MFVDPNKLEIGVEYACMQKVLIMPSPFVSGLNDLVSKPSRCKWLHGNKPFRVTGKASGNNDDSGIVGVWYQVETTEAGCGWLNMSAICGKGLFVYEG